MDKTHYPNLQILPTKNIFPHEHHDPQRTPPLIEALQKGRILHNPPLVASFDGSDEKYMVLDGANRITAFKKMEYDHILAQVVNPNSSDLNLGTWNHVIWNLSPSELIQHLSEINGVTLVEVPFTRPQTFSEKIAAYLETPDLKRFQITIEVESERNMILNEIVNAYKSITRYDRSPMAGVEQVSNYYDDLAGLVIYPPITVPEVISLCRANDLLPGGITRFMVSPRALRINYPLDQLGNHIPLEEKRDYLHKYLKRIMSKKGVRIYTETTVLYDE